MRTIFVESCCSVNLAARYIQHAHLQSTNGGAQVCRVVADLISVRPAPWVLLADDRAQCITIRASRIPANSQTTEKALPVPMRTRKGIKVLIVALVVSAGAAILLVAESMSPSHLGNATPRINASTVGQGLGALAAFAWIAFVWMCTKIRNALDVLLRIVISVALLLVATYFLFFAMLEMFMVG